MRPLALLIAAWTSIASGQAPEVPPAEDAPIRVHGVLVDVDGAPVEGATLSLRAGSSSTAGRRSTSLPKGWQPPRAVTTGVDGKFELSFAPAGKCPVYLDCDRPGNGKLGWRWAELAPDAVVDLGRTTLEPAAILVGHILDREGALLTDGWTVTAIPTWQVARAELAPRSSIAQVDPATGMFRFEDLVAGSIRFAAFDGNQMLIEGTIVTEPGAVTPVELRYLGPDASRRLLVSISTKALFRFAPEVGSVRAIGGRGDEYALLPTDRTPSLWEATGLPRGLYRIEVRDPMFEAATLYDVSTGSRANVQLAGSAALEVEVVDAETGAPVDDFGLEVRYLHALAPRQATRLRALGAQGPPPGRYTGIVPGSIELFVQRAGQPFTQVPVHALQPGETRRVRVEVASGTTLAGRVVDAEGSPLPGVRVDLTRSDIPGQPLERVTLVSASSSASGVVERSPLSPFDRTTTTDSAGVYNFDGLAAGRYFLRAATNAWCAAVADVELPRDRTCVLSMWPSVPVSLRVRLPPGIHPERLSLTVDSGEDSAIDPIGHLIALQTRVACGADGAFPTLQLPIGARTVTFSCSQTATPSGATFVAVHTERLHLVAGEAYSCELDLCSVLRSP